jgi:hypothetical protein
MYKRVGMFFLAAIAAAVCLAISDHTSMRAELGVSSAQAYVNRSLYQVPVSYAAPTSVVQCAGTIGHGFC